MVAAVASRAVDYDLYPIQHDFVTDPSRYCAFIGGRGSGKTHSGSVKAVLRASRGGLGCIAAPSFPMLEHGAKAQFVDRLNELGVDYRQNRSSVAIPSWDAEAVFVTLESESRVRGPNYAWGWADEVEYVTDRKVWQALKGAVRDGDDYELWVTSTPKGRRLVYDEWVANPTERHKLYRATTFDNLFIDAADYVAGLGYEGVFYDQEISADFVSFEGLVYSDFNRERNVKQVDTTGWGTVLAMDVGTSNPTVILTLRYGGDRLHIERELYKRGMSSDDITDAAERAWNEHKPEYLVIDPSAASIIASLQRRGIRVRKAVNDVLIGISRVMSVIPNLTVDPSCVNTINEFESYQYAESKTAERDVPKKMNDHAMDSCRYGVMEIFGKPQPVITGPSRITQQSVWG
jgi:phage terminase large subunit